MKTRRLTCVPWAIGAVLFLGTRPLAPAETGGLLGGSGADVDLSNLNMTIRGERGDNPKAVLSTAEFNLDYNTFEFNHITKVLVATGDAKRPLSIDMKGQGFKAYCDKLTYDAGNKRYELAGRARIEQTDSKSGSMTMAGDAITIVQPSEGELKVEIRRSASGGGQAMLSTRPGKESGSSKSPKESRPAAASAQAGQPSNPSVYKNSSGGAEKSAAAGGFSAARNVPKASYTHSPAHL